MSWPCALLGGSFQLLIISQCGGDHTGPPLKQCEDGPLCSVHFRVKWIYGHQQKNYLYIQTIPMTFSDLFQDSRRNQLWLLMLLGSFIAITVLDHAKIISKWLIDRWSDSLVHSDQIESIVFVVSSDWCFGLCMQWQVVKQPVPHVCTELGVSCAGIGIFCVLAQLT